MSRKKRDFRKNTYYHIYNRGNNKEQVFKYSNDKQLFISLLYKYRKGTDLGIDRYTIMDNHFHLVLRLGNHPDITSKYMQRVCTAYAMYINNKYSHIGHIFQGRYHAKMLRYKKDIVQVRRYVEQNPVKEGYVKKAEDYPWSKSQ